MAKRKNYGVLTLQLKGEDSGLSSTMNKASKSTSRMTGTIGGLGQTFTESQSKLGLLTQALDMGARSLGTFPNLIKLITAEGKEWNETMVAFADQVRAIPMVGTALTAIEGAMESYGIQTAAEIKRQLAFAEALKKVREELQKVNQDVWAQTAALRERARLTDIGMTDTQIADLEKRNKLIALAADVGNASFDRAMEKMEIQRQKIEDKFVKSGMTWGEAFDKSTREVNAIRTSFIEFEKAGVKLAQAQLDREKEQKERALVAAHEGNMQQIFRDRLKFRIEARLGKDSAAKLGAMSASKEDMRKIVARSYRAAVKLAQDEQAKVDIAKRLGVDVGDLAEFGASKLQQMVARQRKVSMSEIDKRANNEVGRLLIAAEHMAKVEGDRMNQEREAEKLAKAKAVTQKEEAARTKILTRLTRERTTAERDLLSVQRMAMGDQFAFQGVMGSIRIADRGDTQRLQVAHTEALDRVNRTLLNIDSQLETIAT